MDNRPIGVFDSGLGGLTVVKELIKKLPNENIVYLGDTARVPYGTRSEATIKKFAFQDLSFLLSKNVKCIVIACNTASSVAANLVVANTDLRVFDTISSCVKGVESTMEKVGVLATNATIKSGAYEAAIRKKYGKVKVISFAAPLLVPLIEEGELDGEIIELVVKKYINMFGNYKMDGLVLGCTHFPIIKKLFQRLLSEVKLLDPAENLAEDVGDYLARGNLLNKSDNNGRLFINVTDKTDKYQEVASMFLGKSVKFLTRQVSLQE